MSDDSQKSPSAANHPPGSESKSKPKAGWSAGDYLLRGLLAALSLLLILEFTSQRNYGATLEDAATVIAESEERGLVGEEAKTSDVVGVAHGFYWESSSKSDRFNVTELRWPSFFKDYRIMILSDNDGSVMALKTADPESLEQREAEAADSTSVAEESPDDDIEVDAGPTADELPVPDPETPSAPAGS